MSLDAGADLIPRYGDGKVKSQRCVCGAPACAHLSKLFRSLGDIRGSFTTVPIVSVGSRKANSENETLREHLDDVEAVCVEK